MIMLGNSTRLCDDLNCAERNICCIGYDCIEGRCVKMYDVDAECILQKNQCQPCFRGDENCGPPCCDPEDICQFVAGFNKFICN